MKRLLNVICFLLLIGATTFFICGCRKEAGPASAEPEALESAEPHIEQQFCPVMGGPIDKNIYVDYEGRRIYFCCNACIKEFNKNPQKYLEILDKGVAPETQTPHGHEEEHTHEGHEGH